MLNKIYTVSQVDRRIARGRATFRVNHNLLKDDFEGYSVPRTRGIQCLTKLNEWLFARKIIDTEEYRKWIRLTETLRSKRGNLELNEAFVNINYLLTAMHSRIVNKLLHEQREAERERREALAAIDVCDTSNEFTLDDFCMEFKLGENKTWN